MNAKEVIRLVSKPTKVWARSDVLSGPNPVPTSNGIYAWFF